MLSTSWPCSSRPRTIARPALPLPPVTAILIRRSVGCARARAGRPRSGGDGRSGRLPDDELRRDQMLLGRRFLARQLVDQHLRRHPARLEGRPIDAGERGRQHLGVLGGDHRDDGEVVGDVEVGCAQGAEQAGELPAGRDGRGAIGLGAQQPRRDRECVARGMRAGDVDAADAEVGRAALEDVPRDQRRRVAAPRAARAGS